MLRHLDLFSGIGGFALAARWTGKVETIGFCEIDPWCRRVLAKHWPDVIQHDDIKTLTGSALEQFGRIDLITGGYPCQGFSSAGRGRGKDDDRYLWPEMLRVVSEARPRFVLVENSPRIKAMVLDDMCNDLESIGYSCGAIDIPALAVGAQHERNRMWVVAYDASERLPGSWQPLQPIHPATDSPRQATQLVDGYQGPSWPDQSGVGRVVHGVPEDMDRLRGLGNAIVPAVAYEILSVMIGEAA